MNVPDPLAQHRMARARATLEEATLLLERGMLVGALNRVYYAAFYAARALLATRQLDSSRHSGVISLFQEHFVRTALVAPELARALPRAFEKRQTSDYDDFIDPSREELISLRDQVGAFLDACDEVLRRP